jgi:hypothetical protein
MIGYGGDVTTKATDSSSISDKLHEDLFKSLCCVVSINVLNPWLIMSYRIYLIPVKNLNTSFGCCHTYRNLKFHPWII